MSIRAPLGAFLCLVIALVGGCQNLCVRNSDCPPGYTCEPSGLCEPGPIALPGQADAGTGADSGVRGESADAVTSVEDTEGVQAPAPPAADDDVGPEGTPAGW